MNTTLLIVGIIWVTFGIIAYLMIPDRKNFPYLFVAFIFCVTLGIIMFASLTCNLYMDAQLKNLAVKRVKELEEMLSNSVPKTNADIAQNSISAVITSEKIPIEENIFNTSLLPNVVNTYFVINNNELRRVYEVRIYKMPVNKNLFILEVINNGNVHFMHLTHESLQSMIKEFNNTFA